jgi:hypothetical protein
LHNFISSQGTTVGSDRIDLYLPEDLNTIMAVNVFTVRLTYLTTIILVKYLKVGSIMDFTKKV